MHTPCERSCGTSRSSPLFSDEPWSHDLVWALGYEQRIAEVAERHLAIYGSIRRQADIIELKANAA